MSENIEYKYRIDFSQSLTTGVIAFHGHVHFDHAKDGLLNTEMLLEIFRSAENQFKKAGYRVASDIIPKSNDSGNKTKEANI